MTALTPAERTARSRKRRKREGGRAIHHILSPEAAEKLARWEARGLGVGETIEKLLLRSKP